MGSIIDWLSGKKTYILAFIVAVEAGLQYMGIVIPGWVDTLLAALGLTTLRAAVAKSQT